MHSFSDFFFIEEFLSGGRKNKWFRYKVNKITAVYPNQAEVIQPTKTDTLTLYTRTGFYDEKKADSHSNSSKLKFDKKYKGV